MKTSSAAATTTGKVGPGIAVRWADAPWLSWALLLGAGIVALGPLTPTWDSNPNYSFGWWIPVVCLVLFAERWPVRPERKEVGSARLTPWLLIGGLLFLGFRLAAETDPEWRPGLWILVGLYVVALTGWLWREGGRSWVRHFAFPLGFLFLCLPWPFEIEYPLVQGLMRWNAVLVASSLQGLGISAEPTGNIIQLQNCQLGVEEACSGILSLQASLVMGCLLGDIYRLTIRHRFLLVLVSMTLALIGNYLRTFFLALMAFYSGPEAVPQWHDSAGYAILIFTAIGSWLGALYLADLPGKVPETGPAKIDSGETREVPKNRNAFRFACAVFGVALLVELATQGWFGWRESSLARHPEWAVRYPTTNPSFKEVALSEITLQALRCDAFETAQWRDAKGWSWSAYWLRYEPKPYTRVVLSWHTPDNCLPSVGLIKDKEYPEFTVNVNGLDLLVRPKKFLSKDVSVYIFWLVYPLRGNLPPENYKTAAVPLSEKIQSHFRDIWNGYRGVEVETLEIALIGPSDYEAARDAYLAGLRNLAQPGPFTKKNEPATSH